MTLLSAIVPKLAPISRRAGAVRAQSETVNPVTESGLEPVVAPIRNPACTRVPLQLVTDTVSMLNLWILPQELMVMSRIRAKLLNLQFVTVTREMSPE